MNNENTFKKEIFAELLDRAKGERSINRYADETGVSAAHISRFLRSMVDAPPTPETISKLSSKAYNEVTYRDLMAAAGHITLTKENGSVGLDGFEDDDSNTSSSFTQGMGRVERISPLERREKIIDIEKKYIQIILSHMYEAPFKWNMNKPEGRYTPDMIFDIDHDGYKKWIFDFKATLNDNPFMVAFTQSIYGKFAILRHEPTGKVTIVVNTNNFYNQLFNRPPLSLRANIYVMLVDVEKSKIVKEEKLCSYYE